MRNVSVKVFDGTYGWREHAPYDAIVVAAAAPEVPAPLVSQLSATGRLVVPVGPPDRQRLLVVKKLPSGRTRTEDAGDVAYVPLVGKFGSGRRSRRADGAADVDESAAGTATCAACSCRAASRASATAPSRRGRRAASA